MVELCGMLVLAWVLVFIVLFIGGISAVSVKDRKQELCMNRKRRFIYRSHSIRKIING